MSPDEDQRHRMGDETLWQTTATEEPSAPESDPAEVPHVEFDLDADADTQAEERPSAAIKIGGRVYVATCPPETVWYHCNDPDMSIYERGEMLRRSAFGQAQYEELRQREMSGDGMMDGTIERSMKLLTEHWQPWLNRRSEELGTNLG